MMINTRKRRSKNGKGEPHSPSVIVAHTGTALGRGAFSERDFSPGEVVEGPGDHAGFPDQGALTSGSAGGL